MFKTLHTFSETEVYVDKTVNNLSSLSHEMHSVTIFPKIHEHFCHSHFTICKTLYFLHIFFKANTLLPKLHSNQHDGQLCISAGIIIYNHRRILNNTYSKHNLQFQLKGNPGVLIQEDTWGKKSSRARED